MYYIDPTFTTKKINKALKEQREVAFRYGTYKLKECLILHSNTMISCETGAIFERHHKGRMLQTFADEHTSKYNGVHDVTWSGGIFKADTNDTSANVITLFHAKHIILNDVFISGCCGYHSIEVNACRDVTIRDCHIIGQSSKPDETFREAIQIDFASYDSLKIKGAKNTAWCYDNTHCCDIHVKNTTIETCPNGFGTHSVAYEEDYHRNIILENVKFVDIEHNDVQLFGVDGFTMSNTQSNVTNVTDVRMVTRPPVVHIGTKTKGHPTTGGKKVLTDAKVSVITPRRNKNIRIENVLID